jgi:hypothetical protein
MSFFGKNKNRQEVLDSGNSFTAFLIYTDGTRYLEHLCLNNIPLAKSNIFIPNIGETFLDKVAGIEYEVKDVVRSFDGAEYGVQVQLKRREKKKYAVNTRKEKSYDPRYLD